MPSNDPLRSFSPPQAPQARLSRSALRHLRRVIVAVIGATVLAIGVAMIVLPGPAMVVIPLGLGILAIEFAWARRMLDRLKKQGAKVLGREAPN
jgi:tellurite resistance protein TerC